MHVTGRPQAPDPATARGAHDARQDGAAGEVPAATALLVGCIALALALRFFRLGDWGLDSDEVFMLRDSLSLRLSNPRPLMYLLNHYVILPFVPLDEFGLRLLPAIFGVLTVPAFYLVGRRFLGREAALLGALLVATSSLLVYYSQFARYWTLVFLLCTVYPFVLYSGLRDRHGWQIAGGLLLAVLAGLAHPVSVLLLGAVGVWLFSEYSREGQLSQLWGRQGVRRGIIIAAILLVLILIRFVPVLENWIQAHDMQKLAGETGEFLYRVPGGRAVGRLSLLLGYVESLTLPLVLCGLLGIYLLCRRPDPAFGILLACLFLVPIAFILLVSVRTAISLQYLLPAAPALFFGAGEFLAQLPALRGTRSRWLLSGALTIIIISAGAPTLISQYRDGRRHDFRGVAGWLRARLRPGDLVVSDQPWVMMHYLPQTPVERLVSDSTRLERALDSLVRKPEHASALWIVSPAPSHAFRTNPRLGELNGWMYHHCQLLNTVGTGRIDFRQNFLQVFRCPPASEGARALAARRTDPWTHRRLPYMRGGVMPMPARAFAEAASPHTRSKESWSARRS